MITEGLVDCDDGRNGDRNDAKDENEWRHGWSFHELVSHLIPRPVTGPDSRRGRQRQRPNSLSISSMAPFSLAMHAGSTASPLTSGCNTFANRL